MSDYTFQEDLSISYLQAICAEAKADMTVRRKDSDSKDVTISKKVTLSTGVQIAVDLNVQLKSTYSKSEYSINGNEITYKLKAKNYNDLCEKTTTSIILALHILPGEDNWIRQDHEELAIYKSMYWCSLSGCNKTSNSSSVSIKLLKDNLMTPSMLNSLLIKIAEEGSI